MPSVHSIDDRDDGGFGGHFVRPPGKARFAPPAAVDGFICPCSNAVQREEFAAEVAPFGIDGLDNEDLLSRKLRVLDRRHHVADNAREKHDVNKREQRDETYRDRDQTYRKRDRRNYDNTPR